MTSHIILPEVMTSHISHMNFVTTYKHSHLSKLKLSFTALTHVYSNPHVSTATHTCLQQPTQVNSNPHMSTKTHTSQQQPTQVNSTPTNRWSPCQLHKPTCGWPPCKLHKPTCRWPPCTFHTPHVDDLPVSSTWPHIGDLPVSATNPHVGDLPVSSSTQLQDQNILASSQPPHCKQHLKRWCAR